MKATAASATSRKGSTAGMTGWCADTARSGGTCTTFPNPPKGPHHEPTYMRALLRLIYAVLGFQCGMLAHFIFIDAFEIRHVAHLLITASSVLVVEFSGASTERPTP